jgi:hypothetical protein
MPSSILPQVAFDFGTLRERLLWLDGLPPGNPRGKALEMLVCDMFSSLPGVEVAARNVQSGSGDAEFDVLLLNEQRDDGLPGFDRDVLIECKSSETPLASRDVTHFVEQAKLRHLRWSIIVSLAGLTGDVEDARAAHRVVERAAEHNTWVMLFVRSELLAIRSAEHLAAVIQRKRSKTLLKLRAITLAEDDLRSLDPSPGGVKLIKGIAGLQQAIRRAQDDALRLILDEAVSGAPADSDADAVEQARDELAALDHEVMLHRQQPDNDPLWRDVHTRIVAVGAAFARLLDEDLADPESRRRVSFDVRVSAPQKLDAHAGGELWNLISAYRLREVASPESYIRARNATAMLAMAVEEIIAIDDIDPRDVYETDQPG